MTPSRMVPARSSCNSPPGGLIVIAPYPSPLYFQVPPTAPYSNSGAQFTTASTLPLMHVAIRSRALTAPESDGARW
jgi:hypothetical protein